MSLTLMGIVRSFHSFVHASRFRSSLFADVCLIGNADQGVIDKKTWLAFLDELEHKAD